MISNVGSDDHDGGVKGMRQNGHVFVDGPKNGCHHERLAGTDEKQKKRYDEQLLGHDDAISDHVYDEASSHESVVYEIADKNDRIGLKVIDHLRRDVALDGGARQKLLDVLLPGRFGKLALTLELGPTDACA